MILELLQNPIFMYAFTLSIIIFIILYMWRKIIGVESNIYLLEKRINNIKKSLTSSTNDNNDNYNDLYIPNNINENIRAADLIMSEVFNNMESDKKSHSITNEHQENHHKERKSKKVAQNSASTVHNVDIISSDNNESHLEKSNSITFAELLNSPVIKHTHDNINNEIYLTSLLQKNKDVVISDATHSNKLETTERHNIVTDDLHIKDTVEKLSIHSDEDKLEKDTTKSEIMTTIKLSGRKLLKQDLGKLKEYCSILNVSSEGTKTQIIDRLLLL